MQALCSAHYISLHVRTHPEHMSSIPDFVRVSPNFNIVDQVVALGPVEVLSFMDALIADISSIIMEGFACHIPVAHLIEEEEVMAYEPNLPLPDYFLRDAAELLSFISGVKSGAVDNKSILVPEIFGLKKGCTLEEAYGELFD